MTLIRPRLNDYHDLPFIQDEVDFAIPFLDEDLPLYVDPFLHEVRELSKKKPDGPLNEVKIKMINRVLVQIKGVLSADPSVEYLDLLDEETLAQNSDAVLILGQYRAAMEQFKKKHHGYDSRMNQHRWFTQDG